MAKKGNNGKGDEPTFNPVPKNYDPKIDLYHFLRSNVKSAAIAQNNYDNKNSTKRGFRFGAISLAVIYGRVLGPRDNKKLMLKFQPN